MNRGFKRSLAGWTGDVSGYAAEPGVLKSTEKGGNLFHESELSDFVFRFERAPAVAQHHQPAPVEPIQHHAGQRAEEEAR